MSSDPPAHPWDGRGVPPGPPGGVPYPRNWSAEGAVPHSPPLGLAYSSWDGGVPPWAAAEASAGHPYLADPFARPGRTADDYRDFGARPVPRRSPYLTPPPTPTPPPPPPPPPTSTPTPTSTPAPAPVSPSRLGKRSPRGRTPNEHFSRMLDQPAPAVRGRAEARPPRFTGYKLQVRSLRVIWSVVFLAVVFLPLVLAPRAGGELRPWSRGGIAIELCLTSGLLALSTMAATVILPSRMRSISRAFGIEGVMHSHKLLALVTTGLVLLHVVFVVLDHPANVALLNPAASPPRARAGETATVALLLICWLSLRRRSMGTRYEQWRMVHAILAVVVLAGTYLHIYFLNHLMRDVAERSVFLAVLLFIAGVFGNRWLLRPLRSRRRAYVIKSVRTETASTSTMTLAPARRRQPGLRYRAGQFAWIRLDSPFGPLQGHPFTIASAPDDSREIQFTIRNAGDFTGSVTVLAPGRKVFVDGPYGDFNDDHLTCKSLLLVSAGIGITPMMSILRSHAHRRDRRPHVLLACARTESELMFRDELAHLEKILNLTVIEVLSAPPPGWTGIGRRLDGDVLADVLGRHRLRRPAVFICGPPAMMTQTRAALHDLGVEDRAIHTEDFAMV